MTTSKLPAGAVSQQLRLLVLMYLGYAGFMLLKTAIVVAGPAILSDPTLNITKTQWGAILGYGTLGGILGKFIFGWASDKFGGKITFATGLFITASGVLAFGLSTNAFAFSVIFLVTLLAKSSGWPAMAKLIGNWFAPNQFGRVWGVLSTSSRVGTSLATLGLGYLLSLYAWQPMLWMAGAVGLVLVLAFAFLVKEHPAQGLATQSSTEAGLKSHHLYGTTLPEALLDFAKSKRVWLIAGSMMGLTVMWDFLNFLPIYLNETLGLTASQASMTATAFPVGSIFSVLFGGFLFDKLSKSAITKLIGFSLSLAVLSLYVLMKLPEWQLSSANVLLAVIASLLVFGLAVSPAYYLPMSIFSIDYGGPHSGILISLLDAVGFAASMAFSFIGGAIADQADGWNKFLGLLILISIASCLVTVWFLHDEDKISKSPPRPS